MKREPIYVALANLVFNAPTVKAAYVSTGRYLFHHSQVPGGASAMPAIYLNQAGENHVRAGKGVPDKRTLRCQFVLYFSTPDPQAGLLAATACNVGLDAIDDAVNLPGNPQNVQTLGGLVEHVYIEGAVQTFEGLLQDISVVVVPITIVIP